MIGSWRVMSRKNPLSSPQLCRMASSVIGTCNRSLKSPTVDLPPAWQVNGPMLHITGQKLYAGVRMDMAKETGHLPSLKDLYERTHKNKSRQFIDPKSEQIYNEVVARIEDRQTQLTQQSLDGIPVRRSHYPHLKWIRFTKRLSIRKMDVRWGLVPSMMFQKRHRLMVWDGLMKSPSCFPCWTWCGQRSQLVWVQSKAF